jgi:mannose-6-phosphate isomerase-like protein (cupin superfamily)
MSQAIKSAREGSLSRARSLTGKIWGTTELLLPGKMCEIHRLVVKPNAQCSRHRHDHKWNAFLVLEGALSIDVFQKAYELVDTTELRAGDLTTVAPGLDHMFRTGDQPCVALEIYYPKLCEDLVLLSAGDIVRGSVGKVMKRKPVRSSGRRR